MRGEGAIVFMRGVALQCASVRKSDSVSVYLRLCVRERGDLNWVFIEATTASAFIRAMMCFTLLLSLGFSARFLGSLRNIVLFVIF